MDRMIALVIVALSIVKKIRGTTNWYIGRVPPSRFEYPRNNGWMLPYRAVDVCEHDLKCGGFTFKGSKDIVRNYEIYFFHYINTKLFDPKEVKFPHWTSYIVSSRRFVMLNGVIPVLNGNDVGKM